MKCFITGANGFIGLHLAKRLSVEGHSVKCLVRSQEKFADLAHLPGVTSVVGDLDNMYALENGTKNCEIVFHMAAMAKPWSKDKTLPFRVNVNGTENILKASLNAGVRRLIYTSSAAVIGPSPGEEPVDELYVRRIPFFNDYEKTKHAAEKLVCDFSKNGLETVIVNPSRVFGPGPVNPGNSVTRIIELYDKGIWRIVPGDGRYTGNYVYIDDVVNGHLLAGLKGRTGERYILGGDNLSFSRFFEVLEEVTGKKRWLVHFPLQYLVTVAALMERQAGITGIAPLITVPWIRKYMNHWSISSKKAEMELGYHALPFREGVDRTLRWIRYR